MGPLNSVMIENHQNHWIRVTDADEVQRLLVERNTSHFNQAAETPLGDPDIMATIGWSTELDWCQEILAGWEHAPLNDRMALELSQAFFQHLSMATQSIMDSEITLEEFKSEFSAWKETTSTSPLSCHLSHYKSLFVADSWDKEKDGPNPGFKILQIHFWMMLIALCSNHNFIPRPSLKG